MAVLAKSKTRICQRNHKGYSIYYTSDVYIIAEYVALANARRFPRLPVLTFVRGLTNSSNIEVVWIDQSLHQAAVDLLLIRQDKTYSLCDAVSFVLMRQRQITTALTTDRHFEQEGFIRLLRL